MASLRARVARLERQHAERQGQLERYAADLRDVFKQERDRAQQLRRSYKATVLALADAVEARDAYTGKHAERVAGYGLRLAHAAGVDVDPQVEFGFLLHDIGKVAVPDGILFKPGPLSEDEMRLVRMHPLTGSEILRHVDFLDEAASVVRHHHERWDGGGYPDRLEGDAIPLPARVFAVADTLDALTSTRPYREQVSFAEARRRIVAEAGSQFDRTIVAAYETVPDEAFERIRDGLAWAARSWSSTTTR